MILVDSTIASFVMYWRPPLIYVKESFIGIAECQILGSCYSGHCQYEMEPLSVGISIDVSPEKVPTMSITLLHKPSDQDEIKEI